MPRGTAHLTLRALPAVNHCQSFIIAALPFSRDTVNKETHSTPKPEGQLSQRGHARHTTLRYIKNSANTLKVIQNYITPLRRTYVSFCRYSAATVSRHVSFLNVEQWHALEI